MRTLVAHAPSFVESGELRIQVAISDLSLHQGSRASSEAQGSPYFPSDFGLILSAGPSLLSLGPPGPLPAQCHRTWEQPLNAIKARSGLEVTLWERVSHLTGQLLPFCFCFHHDLLGRWPLSALPTLCAQLHC